MAGVAASDDCAVGYVLLHDTMNLEARLALRQKYVALANCQVGDRRDNERVVFNDVGSHAGALSAKAHTMTPAEKFLAKDSKCA
jgi:hypothetical protein